jgi:disulfide bond formation protein DsbB
MSNLQANKKPDATLPGSTGGGALVAALLAIAGLGIALYLQHIKDLQPCAWCTFQRLLYIVLALLALVAWAFRGNPMAARSFYGLAMLTGLGGIAAALYQNFFAASDLSCGLSLADKVVVGMKLDQLAPWMFQATAMCDEANVPMLGIPFSLWSAALFALLTGILLTSAVAKGAR